MHEWEKVSIVRGVSPPECAKCRRGLPVGLDCINRVLAALATPHATEALRYQLDLTRILSFFSRMHTHSCAGQVHAALL